MRQTSQAVLLLIASAQAADAVVNYKAGIFTAAAGAQVTVSDQGKPLATFGPGAALATGQPIYQFLAYNKQSSTIAVSVATTSSPATAGVALSASGTLSCKNCVISSLTTANTARNIWCSAAWNYNFVALPSGVAYPNAQRNSADELTFDKAGGSSTGGTDVTAAALKGDQGSCCYLATVMATIQVLTTGANQDANHPSSTLNKYTCPAKFSNDWKASNDTTKTKDLTFMKTTNWWCSDGSYNASATASTGATFNPASQLMADKTLWVATNSLGGTTGSPALLGDQRRDLMLAACRQKQDWCGGSSMVAPGADGVAVQRKTKVGFPGDEKCTWTIMSATKAPSFRITSAATAFGTKWDIMYQEWVDGWQLDVGVDFLPQATGAEMNGIVYPHILAGKYAKVAKYNYDQQADTLAATQNDARRGMAYSYVNNQAPTACVLTLVSTTFSETSTCFSAQRTQRWFSADQAVAGTTLAGSTKTAYETAVGDFNTKATAYNKYLADLKTANEKDAFAAAFAPPEKPAMVVRPTSPTPLVAYSGLQHWSALKQQQFLEKNIAGIINEDEYVLGNQPNQPGWGAWTIGRINTAKVLAVASTGIWHSFGAVGTNTGLTNTQSSYLKRWGIDAAIVQTLTPEQFRVSSVRTPTYTSGASTNMGETMCQSTAATKTAPTDKCLVIGSATASVANTRNVYLSVSLWSNNDINSALTSPAGVIPTSLIADGFVIDFYVKDWESGDSYYAPVGTGTAATALTTPAAAQALVASAAAALAVAAALY